MQVTLLAHTYLGGNNDTEGLFKDIGWEPESVGFTEDGDSLSEFAGRACYQSWNRPNPDTATNEGYMKHILDVGHESVLEHTTATFYVTGISRYLTHELVRHRHGSWSQLSTRYVNEEDGELVRHPAMNDQDWVRAQAVHAYAVEVYAEMVEDMVKNRGMKRKQAREAARFVLPGGLETKIVMTGNIRSYRDILKRRWHVAADAEIRDLAGELLHQLRTEVAPNSFQDFPDKPFGLE